MTINDTTSVRNLNRNSGSVDLESDKTDSESVNSTASVARNAGDAAGTCSTHKERREETRECVTQADIDPETQHSPPGHVSDQGATGASNIEVSCQQAPMEYMDSNTESIWSAGLHFDNPCTRKTTARRNKLSLRRRGQGRGERGGGACTMTGGNEMTQVGLSYDHPLTSSYCVEQDGHKIKL